MDSVNKIKVSVIIPVYNVEAYIGRCIDSFKSQTMQELEFIFVDDCGTDQSMKIVEEFAATDKRVHIIKNEQNLGTGPSRNTGIEAAQGEYLSFIDPDDYISSSFYSLLYNAAKKNDYDIAKGASTVMFEESDRVRDKANLNDSIREGLYNNAPLYTTFVFGHWSAIYRKSLFNDGMVRYGTYKHSQDIVYLFRVSLKAESIILEDNAKYYYTIRKESASANKTSERFFADLGSLEEIIETKERLLGEDLHSTSYLSNRIGSRINAFCAAAEENKAVATKEEDYIKKLQAILSKLSDSTLLFKCMPEVAILMKYNYLVPTSGTSRLKRWTEFFKRYPFAEKRFCYRYSEGVCTALFGRNNPFLGQLSRHSRLILVWQQLRSLDAKTRRMVILRLPGSFISLVLKRLRARK